MRIRSTDERQRRLERLKEATGESTKSGAIDEACKFYLEMAAVDQGYRVGKLEELLSTAADRGSLTTAEIAQILSTPQVQLEASTTFEISDGS